MSGISILSALITSMLTILLGKVKFSTDLLILPSFCFSVNMAACSEMSFLSLAFNYKVPKIKSTPPTFLVILVQKFTGFDFNSSDRLTVQAPSSNA